MSGRWGPAGRAPVVAAVVLLVVAVVVFVVLLRRETAEMTLTPDRSADAADAVFVGDSITRGVSPETREPDERYSWVTYVVDDTRSPWRLAANVSYFGRTLPEMQAFFDTEVLTLEPDVVVVMGGTNDALQGLPPQQSADALRQMVEACRRAGIEVWVVAPPPHDEEPGLAATAGAEAAVAEELGVPFVDLTPALGTYDDGWVAGASDDGEHPSEEGARQIADVVLDRVAQ